MGFLDNPDAGEYAVTVLGEQYAEIVSFYRPLLPDPASTGVGKQKRVM